jgi:hypothetical protein
MTQFEYLVTFTAFLYAVMVGRIFITLSGLSLKNLDRLHVAWLIVLVANLIQAWWKGWSFHDMEFNYGLYLLEVSHTIPLFFAVGALTPNREPEDWSIYFQSIRVRFFLSYILLFVTLGISNYVFSGIWYSTIGAIIFSLLGLLFKNRIVQWAVVLIFMLMFIAIGIRMAQG